MRYWSQMKRRQWKNDAIPAIANLAQNKSWREKEIEILARLTENEHVIEKAGSTTT